MFGPLICPETAWRPVEQKHLDGLKVTRARPPPPPPPPPCHPALRSRSLSCVSGGHIVDRDGAERSIAGLRELDFLRDAAMDGRRLGGSRHRRTATLLVTFPLGLDKYVLCSPKQNETGNRERTRVKVCSLFACLIVFQHQIMFSECVISTASDVLGAPDAIVIVVLVCVCDLMLILCEKNFNCRERCPVSWRLRFTSKMTAETEVVYWRKAKIRKLRGFSPDSYDEKTKDDNKDNEPPRT